MQMRINNDCSVRVMEQRDLAAVAAIEADNFSLPWSEQGFLEAIQNSNNVFLVLENKGEIIGYCGAYVVCGEADITNVSIKQSQQNLGFGSVLLDAMLALLIKAGIHAMTLEVRKSNKAAIHLYEKKGFVTEGIRPGFYEKPVEDAVIMWLRRDKN